MSMGWHLAIFRRLRFTDAGIDLGLKIPAIIFGLFGAIVAVAGFRRVGVDRAREELARGGDLIAALRGRSKGKFRRVKDHRVLTDIGVSPVTKRLPSVDDAHRQIAYVERRQDAHIESVLTRRRFVVVTGQAKAGKSRSTFEAVRKTFPRHRLVAPEFRDGPRKLMQTGFDFNDCVLWLDDLEDFLAGASLTSAMIQHVLSHPHAVIAATLRRYRLDEAQASAESRSLLNMAEVVELEAVLDEAESRRAARLLRDASIVDELMRIGIGAVLTGAQELISAFERDLPRESVTYQLIHVAVELQTAGVVVPAPVELILELTRRRLRRRRGGTAIKEEELADALLRAAHPVVGSVAFLEGLDGGLCRATSYLVEHLTRDGGSRPDARFFADLVELVDEPGILLMVGMVGPRWTLREIKLKLSRMVHESSDGGAALALGLLEVKLERLAQSRRWLLVADSLGNECAAYNLGNIFMSLQQPAVARRWYAKAVEQHSDADAAEAMIIIDDVADRDPEDRLVQLVNRGITLEGTHEVGNILERRWSRDRCVEWYRARAHHGDGHAWTHLGVMAEANGHEHEARKYLAKAVEAGDPSGMYHLGAILHRHHRLAQARDLLITALDGGDDRALATLGRVELEAGNHAAAEDYFSRAVGTGDDACARLLVRLLLKRGARRRALRLLHRLGQSGDVIACYLSAVHLCAQGNVEEAELWRLEMISGGGPDIELPSRFCARIAVRLQSNRVAQWLAERDWAQRKSAEFWSRLIDHGPGLGISWLQAHVTSAGRPPRRSDHRPR